MADGFGMAIGFIVFALFFAPWWVLPFVILCLAGSESKSKSK